MATRDKTIEERIVKALRNGDFITSRQLTKARKTSSASGTALLDTLVSSGLLVKETLETVVMSQAGIRTVNLGTVAIDQQATRLVSPEYAQQKCILPIGFAEDGSLQIAVQNFVPAKIVPELMRTIPHKLIFVLAIGGRLDDLIDQAYAPVGSKP